MLLSRFWYVVMSFAVGAALYVVFLAVGQFNRRNMVVMKEGLASDSQTVEWALKIDSRRRLDQLYYASLDGTVQKSLTESNNAKDGKVPGKAKEDARKALASVMDKLKDVAAGEYKPDAIFAVDRDGKVVGEVGFDAVAASDDFELGGFPAVNDALHGFLRDDSWVLGDKLYLVCARPVEVEAGSAPAGAIVALKEFDRKYAESIAKKTRTNLAFYAGDKRLASATGTEGFEESQLEQVTTELPKLDADKDYASDKGRSEAHMLRDDLGAIFTRIPGEAWDEGAGFAVVRARVILASPMGFLSGADDKDKASVPYLVLVPILLVVILIGIGLTLLEHTLPVRELEAQAQKLRAGQIDSLQVARFRGPYRMAAQNINNGIERVIEKGGGTARRPADLEQILGPVPAQPAMSAFAFPLGDPQAPQPQERSSPNMMPAPPPSVPGRAPPAAPSAPGAHMAANATPFHPNVGKPTPPVAMNVPSAPNAFPPAAPPPPPAPPPVAARPAPPPPAAGSPANKPPLPPPAPAPKPLPPPQPPGEEADDDEATMVAQIPAEVLAQATGEHKTNGEATEWLAVYDDFIRTKKQCGEPTEGLTFEKFSHTLKKNRDALMQRHGCKKVKFSVYVKEGRASLKATPVKD